MRANYFTSRRFNQFNGTHVRKEWVNNRLSEVEFIKINFHIIQNGYTYLDLPENGKSQFIGTYES